MMASVSERTAIWARFGFSHHELSRPFDQRPLGNQIWEKGWYVRGLPFACTKVKHARSTNKNPKCDPPEARRIVIVDDHPLFRKGLEQLIHTNDGLPICGEAPNAPEEMA